MFGKIYRVLIESKSENGNTLLARTDSNLTMEIEGGEELIGQFKNAEVTYSSGRTLRGKIV